MKLTIMEKNFKKLVPKIVTYRPYKHFSNEAVRQYFLIPVAASTSVVKLVLRYWVDVLRLRNSFPKNKIYEGRPLYTKKKQKLLCNPIKKIQKRILRTWMKKRFRTASFFGKLSNLYFLINHSLKIELTREEMLKMNWKLRMCYSNYDQK